MKSKEFPKRAPTVVHSRGYDEAVVSLALNAESQWTVEKHNCPLNHENPRKQSAKQRRQEGETSPEYSSCGMKHRP